jgi:hypothetical protein
MNRGWFPPKRITKRRILNCVDYYGKNDIYFDINESYCLAKEASLSRNKIFHEDFSKFIEQTRGIEFTSFYIKYTQ